MKPIHIPAILLAAGITAAFTFQPVSRHTCHATGNVKKEPVAAEKYSKLVERIQRHHGKHAMAACFVPGTDPAIIEALESAIYQSGLDYRLSTRWSGTAGTPRALTWSFVPDGTIIEGVPSDLFARFDAAYASQGGRATWIKRFEDSFARWSQLAGLSYTRVTFGGNDWDDGAAFVNTDGAAGLRGDVRIGGIDIDGPSNVLAYNYYPAVGDMVMDTADTALYAGTANFNRFLRNVVMHEHGHGSGLAHLISNNASFLMEPFINTGFDGPQQDDIRANQQHYGDKFENNNTFSTATDLGALTNAANKNIGDVPADANYPSMPIPSNSAGTAISNNGDRDFYKFTVPTGTTVLATVTPVGTTYSEGPQGGTESPLNAKEQAQLSISILDTNGSTVLATKNAAALGQNASAFAMLSSTAAYYVVVSEIGAPSRSQQYKLNIQTFPTKTISIALNLAPWPKSRNSELAMNANIRAVGTTTSLYNFVLADANNDGVFTATIPGNFNGAQNLRVNGNRWLARAADVNISAGSSSDLGTMTLPSGDTLDSDAINTDDYLSLNESFDKSAGESGYNALCDLNGDEYVGTDDYLALSANFDLAADE